VALFLSLLHVLQGIYTSDSLEKSLDYTDYDGTGFVLLCEVSSRKFCEVKTKGLTLLSSKIACNIYIQRRT